MEVEGCENLGALCSTDEQEAPVSVRQTQLFLLQQLGRREWTRIRTPEVSCRRGGCLRAPHLVPPASAVLGPSTTAHMLHSALPWLLPAESQTYPEAAVNPHVPRSVEDVG